MWHDSDDPLYDAREAGLETEVDHDFVDEVRSWSPSEEEIDDGDIYAGDSVRWIGIQGRMMKLPWDQIASSPMNPFDPRKVSAFQDMIERGERPLLYAPPVYLDRITLDDVRESQQAAEREELAEAYGMTRPYTTGDEELDEFLKDEEEFLSIYAEDEDDEEVMRADMLLRAERAVSDQDGDLGKIVGTLRDGNHRAFGAQLAGEDEVWVTVRMQNPEQDMLFLGLREDDFE